MDRQAGGLARRGRCRRWAVAVWCLFPLGGLAADPAPLIRQTVAELDPLATSLSVDFGVDADAGRAWAEITEHSGDPEAMPTIRQVAVTGLYFDVREAAVVLQARGRRAVCAHRETRGGWLMRRQTLVPTGDCQWQVRPREQGFDNGFELATESGVELVLLGRAEDLR